MTTPRDIRILVVDDDTSIRLILTDLFETAGYQVETAEMPAIAIEKLAAARFDIIFSDINMPGMTGIDLLRELRKANNDVLVVIMTADATIDSAIEATRLGAQDYLHKPFKNLDSVLELAERMAVKVEDGRARDATIGNLVAAAKGIAAGEHATSTGDLGALALKAERMFGITLEQTPNPLGTQQELVGDLTDFPLHEILQLLGMMRKTGILRVSPTKQPRAIISIITGLPYAARFGMVNDLKALLRLMAVTEGVFHFTANPHMAGVQRIEQTTEWIIMEGMRHLDEYNALGKARPPRNLMVRYNGSLHQAGAKVVERFDLTVAEALRKPRSVGQLLDALPDPDLDILQALIRLRKSGALDLLGLAPPPATSTPAAPAAPVPPGTPGRKS